MTLHYVTLFYSLKNCTFYSYTCFPLSQSNLASLLVNYGSFAHLYFWKLNRVLTFEWILVSRWGVHHHEFGSVLQEKFTVLPHSLFKQVWDELIFHKSRTGHQNTLHHWKTHTCNTNIRIYLYIVHPYYLNNNKKYHQNWSV